MKEEGREKREEGRGKREEEEEGRGGRREEGLGADNLEEGCRQA